MLTTVLISFLLIIIGYLFGSIPTGFLAGKWLKGIDIREEGSGSTGATNVLRTLGKPAAFTVLGIDVLKGSLGVLAVRGFYAYINQSEILPNTWQTWLILGAGVAAILGHSRSIFLNFTGGKSVATSLGVFLAMTPIVALATLGTFLLVLTISRIVSLGSIMGAIAIMIYMVLAAAPLPYLLLAIFAGLYVLIRHQSNINRLMAGTEPRIGQKIESQEGVG
ncbi:MAG: glycerol-3-phosphate 1-O-acyltransferase PlsY [Microcystaceae cyanobacterium]